MEEYRKKLVRDIWMARGLLVISFLFIIFSLFFSEQEIQGVVLAVILAVIISAYHQIRENKALLN